MRSKNRVATNPCQFQPETSLHHPPAALSIVAAHPAMTPPRPPLTRKPIDARTVAGRSRRGERQEDRDSATTSSRASLVPLEHAAEFFDADDLFAGRERLVDLGSTAGEGPVADADPLVRPGGIVQPINRAPLLAAMRR